MSEGDQADQSDEVRDGLTVLEQQEAKLAALREAIEEGERSGPFTEVDLEEFLVRMRASKPNP